ncbi:CAF17-like 4Fe-4S cluster assembly/insertion protein YgfZ [Luteimonas sp. e5]
MSDKPNGVQPRDPASLIALPGQQLLLIEGPDALAFAQAQFMNDVALLGDGQWQWSGWLNPKGRLIALFTLLRLDAQTLWLLLPDAEAEDLAAQLQRFVFRSKLQLTPRPSPGLAGEFLSTDMQVSQAEAGTGAAQSVHGDAANGRWLDWPGGRRLHLDAAASAQTEDAEALLRWRQADLHAGIPRLEPSQVEQWTPQQLSLQRLSAFSVKKGCYPGQEIVSRTHFLGQAKRGLRLLRAEGATASGDAVSQDGRDIGRVVSSAGELALAVLPLELTADPLQVGEHAAELLP